MKLSDFLPFVSITFVISNALNSTISVLGSYGESVQGCDHLNRTSFLRSEGMRIQELPRSTIRAVSLNQCAKHCEMKTGAVDCHSFEYNAASQSCALQSAQGQPFGPSIVVNTNEPGIAFFQRVCIAIACFGDTEIHWIRAEDFHIGIEKDVIMSGLTSEECRQACVENMVGAEMFPCRGYVYSQSKQECHLTAESALTKKSVGIESDETDDEGSKSRLSSELSAISAGQYNEKFCIEGPVRCKEVSFELISGRILDSYEKVVQTMSVAHCLHLCLMEAENCTSVMFFKDRNECVLNKKSQFSDPDLFRSASNVDYYDNLCEYEPGTLPTKEQLKPAKNAFATDDESFLSAGESIEQALINFREESLESSSEKQQKPVFQAREPVEKVKGTLETECRLDGIVITAKFEQPTSGAVFIKDHSSTCRTVFTDAIDSQLEIPFPSSVDSNPDCPGVELAPNLWSFIIVIQKNNIGIPSLMTESDRVFNVTCDYSNTAVTAAQRDANKESEFFVTSKSTEEFLGKIRMSILRNGDPVTTVSLGEELELKWVIEDSEKTETGKQKFGYFIDECVAERLDGQPPEPSPLRLIFQGCPDERVRNRLMKYPIVEVEDGFSTKMKAFRFDGSRRVRIRCAVNICVDKCEPVSCESDRDFNSVVSFGKKRKKRQTVADLEELLKKYHDAKLSGDVESDEEEQGAMIEQSTISGTYTILEQGDDAAEAKGNNDSKVSLPLDAKRIAILSSLPTIGNGLNDNLNETASNGNSNCDLFTKSRENQICVIRAVFTGLIILICLLSTVQIFSLINCVYNRFQGPNTLYDENRSLSSTASLTHSDHLLLPDTMASGARPSSNQRSSVSSGGNGSGSENPLTPQKSRKSDNIPAIEDRLSPPSTGLINCVVCGDRACSHYYYGVAACHGCKCFFWRSVKQQAQYFCRYDQKCDINVNARNACRYCRFQRCIRAGMQPEAVRIGKEDKLPRGKKHCLESDLTDTPIENPPPSKKVCDSSSVLLKQLKELEKKAQEEADFNENESATSQNTLQELFAFPEIMDAFRTKVMYCVRLRNVTDEELNFCKFRTLTYAIDYVRSIVSIDLASLVLNDQIALLRHSYGPMTIFNTAVGTITATKEHSLLCLPTGITVSKHESIITNSFMSHIVVVNIIDTLLKPLAEINMSEDEFMLIRAIIVLNGDARGLSSSGKVVVSSLRDQLHNALYQKCQETGNDAPLRFAKILHLLPKIMLLARDLIEHIKVAHTFNSDMRRVDPVFFELFGDIFQDERDHIAHISLQTNNANKDINDSHNDQFLAMTMDQVGYEWYQSPSTQLESL
ncbi:hypothetical protein FO519_002145 [Halicephalobus sp. NKZ332]|nr:hypothetical protein FO519_002145 [Halicephalobus sp. NKZ332]